MSESYLVTGVAGFVGSHLAQRLLESGHGVTGIDSLSDYYDTRIKSLNLEPLLADQSFKFVGESLCDADLDALLDGVDGVFHLAAQAGVRASWGEQFEAYIDSNIRATQKLCEAARRHSIRKIVYAGSSSVYGETAHLPMNESHPTRPVSPYGVTKLDAENLCLLYGRNYGLPVVSLRFFTVFGPRQRPDMAFHRFIRAAIEGASVSVFGNGEQTRDFTFVDDIVDANVAAMEYKGNELVFNIGGGNRVTVNHVLDIIGAHASDRLDVRYQASERGDVTHTFADIALAERELGYAPSISLEEGIARESDWIRDTYRRLAEETSA